MISGKILRRSAAAAIFLLLLAIGCAPIEEQAIEPKKQPPQPKDITTYRLIAESQRSIEFMGSLAKDDAFQPGQNKNRLEMTFDQQIQSVDEKGNAVVKITFKELKYLDKIKNNPAFSFDSNEENKPDHPMQRLIGESYTIEISSTGQVTKIIDKNHAMEMARGPSKSHKTAIRLLSDDSIKLRHGNITLPAKDKNKLRKGDKWNSEKSFTFGMMGLKSYEKIYTLNEIETQNNQRIATIEMYAIPALSEQPQEEINTLTKMFDDNGTFTGRLKLNLDTGKIEKYSEKLQLEWLVIDPEAGEQDKDPDALKMKAVRSYSLEKID